MAAGVCKKMKERLVLILLKPTTKESKQVSFINSMSFLTYISCGGMKKKEGKREVLMKRGTNEERY